MPSRRRRNFPSMVRQSTGLAVAVPEVVAHRLTRLWLAGPRPSQRDHDEFYRMGAEKLAAFYESWNAMFLEAYRASLQLSFSPLWWFWLGAGLKRVAHRASAQSPRAVLAILGRGLGPIQRRATANAKRLRRVRL